MLAKRLDNVSESTEHGSESFQYVSELDVSETTDIRQNTSRQLAHSSESLVASTQFLVAERHYHTKRR